MPLPALLFGAYLVIGVAVAAIIALSDFSKKKTSIAGLLGDIAGLHAIGFLIFCALWPLWLGLLLFSGEETDQSQRAKEAEPLPTSPLRKKPNPD